MGLAVSGRSWLLLWSAVRIRIIIRVRYSRFGGEPCRAPAPRHCPAKAARPGPLDPARRRHLEGRGSRSRARRRRGASPRFASPKRRASASARSTSTSRTSRRSSSASRSTSGRRPGRRSTRSSATTTRPPAERLRAMMRAFFRSECDEAPLRFALDAAAPSYHDAPESRAGRRRSRRIVNAFVAAAAPHATARQRRFAAELVFMTTTAVGKQLSEHPARRARDRPLGRRGRRHADDVPRAPRPAQAPGELTGREAAFGPPSCALVQEGEPALPRIDRLADLAEAARAGVERLEDEAGPRLAEHVHRGFEAAQAPFSCGIRARPGVVVP